MLLSSVSSRALLRRAMTDLGNGVGASTSLGSTSHPSGVEPNSLGPVHRSVSERGRAACTREAGGLVRMRHLHFLRGWRRARRKRTWTKRVSQHPGQSVTWKESVSLALLRGALPGEGSGYRSSRVLNDTAEVALFCVYCR